MVVKGAAQSKPVIRTSRRCTPERRPIVSVATRLIVRTACVGVLLLTATTAAMAQHLPAASGAIGGGATVAATILDGDCTVNSRPENISATLERTHSRGQIMALYR